MTIPHPLCLFDSVRSSLQCGAPVSGHAYAEVAHLSNCNVSIMRCERDGTWLVMWEPTSESRYAPCADETLTEEQIDQRTREAFARLAEER